MKEHPILFSAPMVRALLADRKFVTRRLSPQWMKVKAGDRLWVREGFYVDLIPFDKGPLPKAAPRSEHPSYTIHDSIYYRADGTCCEQIPECCCSEVGPVRWRPSIHMPRWASRILLECEEDTRMERLMDITEEEIGLEGLSRELLRELLLPSLDRRPAVPLHWIHGSDEGVGWCEACARREIRRVRKAEPQKEFILDGGWAVEEDTQPFCEGCGRELDCLYTDHAIGYELDHFDENGMSGVADEHSMYNILAVPASDSENGRIARVGFRWLWRTLHTQPGERWEDNPIVYRVGKFHQVAATPEGTRP